MGDIKKITTGTLVAAMMLATAFFASSAKAQVAGGAANNPVSQWIVLSGLFNPYGGAFGYGAPIAGGAATPYGMGYNPISQWIVLSGLFNPYAFGGYGGSTGGGQQGGGPSSGQQGSHSSGKMQQGTQSGDVY